MKIAITDACIFIDICELQLTDHLFQLSLEVHTSLEVFNELNSIQKEILKAFQSVRKLTVHNLTSTEKLIIQQKAYPNSLSGSDKSVLYLAELIDAIILSSDKTVRHNAKLRSIEYHGMFWIFDRLIEQSLLNVDDATCKLKELINKNIIYQNSTEMLFEMNKRLGIWRK